MAFLNQNVLFGLSAFRAIEMRKIGRNLLFPAPMSFIAIADQRIFVTFDSGYSCLSNYYFSQNNSIKWTQECSFKNGHGIMTTSQRDRSPFLLIFCALIRWFHFYMLSFSFYGNLNFVQDIINYSMGQTFSRVSILAKGIGFLFVRSKAIDLLRCICSPNRSLDNFFTGRIRTLVYFQFAIQFLIPLSISLQPMHGTKYSLDFTLRVRAPSRHAYINQRADKWLVNLVDNNPNFPRNVPSFNTLPIERASFIGMFFSFSNGSYYGITPQQRLKHSIIPHHNCTAGI